MDSAPGMPEFNFVTLYPLAAMHVGVSRTWSCDNLLYLLAVSQMGFIWNILIINFRDVKFYHTVLVTISLYLCVEVQSYLNVST